jgi:hypothetical protein
MGLEEKLPTKQVADLNTVTTMSQFIPILGGCLLTTAVVR